MKIEPNKLSLLIRRASMWSGKPELPTCELDFGEKGVTLAQKNSMDTIGIYFMASRDLFTEYEAIGKIQIPAERIATVADQAFKVDKLVEIRIDKGKIFIDGKNDHYSKELPREDLPTMEFSIRSGKFGIFPKKLDIERYYTLPSGLLKNLVNMEQEKEIYTFEYGEKLIISTKVEDEEGGIIEGFRRDLEFSNTWKDGKGTTRIAADYLNNALAQISGEFTIGFAGEGKPIALTTRDGKSAWCYLIAPWGK